MTDRSNITPLQMRPDPDMWGAEGHQALCPGCGTDYVHPDFSSLHIEHTDDYTSPLGNRGSWVALPMWCENCCARWRIAVGFHKGFTFLGCVRDPDAAAPWGAKEDADPLSEALRPQRADAWMAPIIEQLQPRFAANDFDGIERLIARLLVRCAQRRSEQLGDALRAREKQLTSAEARSTDQQLASALNSIESAPF